MTEKEFRHKKHAIEKKNVEYKQKQELRSLRHNYKKQNGASTSKIILLVVFLLAIQIIIFSEYIMVKYGDFSAMYALIGIPATMVPTLVSYFNKSAKENTTGGIIYDLAMLNRQDNVDQTDEDAVG